MKQLLLSLALTGFTVGAFAQGALIAIDNNANLTTPPPTPSATAGGLFFLQAQAGGPVNAINQDFNLALFGGTDSTSLSLIHSFTGSAAQGVTAAGPGTFTDLSGGTYNVAGTT